MQPYLSLKIKYFIFFVYLFFSTYLTAQDPHFSQFYANRVYLNAAYAGFDPGTTLTLNYRNQWFGIPDGSIGRQAGFRTYNATLGIRIPCFLEKEGTNMGAAISAFKDDTGAAPLTTQGFGGAFSIEKVLGEANNRNQTVIRIGTQFSVMQKSLQSDYLIFSNQLDPVTGLLNNPNAVGLTSSMYSNMNVGVLLRSTYKGGRRGYKSKRLNHQDFQFTIGLNIANVTRPNVSLQGLSNVFRLPMRWTIHGGVVNQLIAQRGVSAPVHVAPQFRIDRQENLNLYTLGTYIFSKAYYFGGFYQFNTGQPATPNSTQVMQGNIFTNTHALILNAGIDIRTLLDFGINYKKRRNGIVLGVSYDFRLSGLSGGASLGTLEVNLRYNFNKSGKSKKCGAIHKSELYNGQCPIRF